MIRKFKFAGGVMLRTHPFSDSNKNAKCEIVAEIKVYEKARPRIRIHIINLSWMNSTDIPILINAMHTILERARQEKSKIYQRAAAGPKKKKITTKAAKKTATKKKISV